MRLTCADIFVRYKRKSVITVIVITEFDYMFLNKIQEKKHFPVCQLGKAEKPCSNTFRAADLHLKVHLMLRE